MHDTLATRPAWLRRTILATVAMAALATGAPAAAMTTDAGTAAEAQDTCSAIESRVDNADCYYDDAPTPPPCDVDQTSITPGGRVCTLAAQKDFVFEAYDLVKGLNRCVVSLRASAPEDQRDAGNRPKIGFRTTVTCEQTLRVVNFTPRIDRATGGVQGSAGNVYCHGSCGLTQTIRGDVYGERNSAYIMRVPIHMRLWEGPDPWIATPPDAQDNNGTASCKPGGYDVYCMLELAVPTADQNPDTPRVRFYTYPPPPTA